jgi:hypothetical protein
MTGEKDNVLYELAQIVAANGGHSVAVALRKLAQAGYSSLDEVDSAPDWTLLSISGLGVGRLGAVRRLTRSDWQPPSPQAVKVVNRFISAAAVARRFWPPEILASLVRGSTLPRAISEGPLEKRVAIDVLCDAARKAQRHCETEDLVQAVWQARHECHRTDCTSGMNAETGAPHNGQDRTVEPESLKSKPCRRSAPMNSERFAYSQERRREIVERFRAARDRGEIANKDRWARSNGNISGKTLLRYEREFPESDAKR